MFIRSPHSHSNRLQLYLTPKAFICVPPVFAMILRRLHPHNDLCTSCTCSLNCAFKSLKPVKRKIILMLLDVSLKLCFTSFETFFFHAAYKPLPPPPIYKLSHPKPPKTPYEVVQTQVHKK